MKHNRTAMRKISRQISLLAVVLSQFSYAHLCMAQGWIIHTVPEILGPNAGTMVGINGIVTDQMGTIWFATNNGLSTFNGTWTYYRSAVEPATNQIQSILFQSIPQKALGYLWMGTSGGLVRINLSDPSVRQVYTVDNTNGGLASNQVNAIVLSADRRLWVGTEDRGISVATRLPSGIDGDTLMRPANWLHFTKDNGLGANRVASMVEDESGNIWVATGREFDSLTIFVLLDSVWQKLALPGGGQGIAGVLHKDSGGRIWVGTNGDGLYQIDAVNRVATAVYTKGSTGNGLASNTITALADDGEGLLWVGHNASGVSIGNLRKDLRQAESWQTSSSFDRLAADNGSAIAEDNEGNVWLGHLEDRGVTQLNRSWLSILRSPGERRNFIHSFWLDSEVRVWIGTENGAVRLARDGSLLFDDEKISRVYTMEDGLEHDNVQTIFEDSHSYLWFGHQAGASRVHIDSLSFFPAWHTFDEDDGLRNKTVKVIVEDVEGNLWFAITGTEASGMIEPPERLFRVHLDSVQLPDKWRTISDTDGIVSNQVADILRDSRNRFWFATDHGVSVIDPTTNVRDSSNWTSFDIGDGLVSNSIEAIHEDHDGNFWFATVNGVSKFSVGDSSWQTLNAANTANGLLSNFVTSIGQLKSGEIWFGTAIGTSRYDLPNELWTTYTVSDGLGSNFITAILTDSINRTVWFGTAGGGATRYRPLARGPATILDTDYDIVSQDLVRFAFHGADLTTPAQQMRFQYRLDSNADDSWRSTADQSITLPVRNSSTKPERHVFEVRALDRDGNLGKPSRDAFYKIDAGLGAEVSIVDSSKSVRLYLPPGAVPKETAISISPITRSDLQDTAKVVIAFDVQPDDLTLLNQKRASLSIAVPASQTSPTVGIFHWQDESWTGFGGTVAARGDSLTVTTAIREFGTYAVRNAAAGERIQKLTLADVDLQPRLFSPAGGGQGYGDRANLSFSLRSDAEVRIKVYDLNGRLQRIVSDSQHMAAGVNSVQWNGRDEDGRICVSGLYVVTIEANGEVQTKTIAISNAFQ